MSINRKLYFIGAISVLILSSFSSDSKKDFWTCQQMYDAAVAEPNWLESLQRLYDVCENCSELQLTNRAYKKAHEINNQRFNRGTYPNRCQFFGHGVNTIEHYKNYLLWMTSQDEDSRRLLGKPPINVNIKTQVRALEELVRRRGLPPSGCNYEWQDFGQLHDIYFEIDEQFFDETAIDNWLNILMHWEGDRNWVPMDQAINFNVWVQQPRANGLPNVYRWNNFLFVYGKWIERNPGRLSADALRTHRRRYERIAGLI